MSQVFRLAWKPQAAGIHGKNQNYLLCSQASFHKCPLPTLQGKSLLNRASLQSGLKDRALIHPGNWKYVSSVWLEGKAGNIHPTAADQISPLLKSAMKNTYH